MKKRLLLLLSGIALAGCLTPPVPDQDPMHPLGPRFEDDRELSDLYVPPNFTLDSAKSSKQIVDEKRIVNLIYRGLTQAPQVIQAYKEKMTHPKLGWELRKEERVPGSDEAVLLAFEKPALRGGSPEVCKVLVERAWKETVVTLQVNYDAAPRGK